MLTEKNKEQIQLHGLSKSDINRQLQIFEEGISFANIVEPASANNGIMVLSKKEQDDFVDLFEANKNQLDLLKFVPASGAATRMFKFLHQFLQSYDPEQEDLDTFLNKSESKALSAFFESIEDFAFSHLVFEQVKAKYPDYDTFHRGKKYHLFVRFMLHEEGLDFGQTPKGLIPFHLYKGDYATAFGEQLYEGAFYAASLGEVKVHFTVSDTHEDKFKKRYSEIQDRLVQNTGVDFEISYSTQKKKTDTIAVTLDNLPFLDENEDLVFRPAGHGALLENLNEVDADIVFIKNIDNVVSKKYVETIAYYKKVLAGKLISLQAKIFGYVKKLQADSPSGALLNEVSTFISEELDISNFSVEKESLLSILDRPTRVCGVVKNTGAPGGGPFRVKEIDGRTTFQIVEMSQIDLNNPKQRSLVENATHFNPVDLVCGIRDYKGEKFDLTDFSDPDAGFISEKSFKGKPIKALERPGLWNGAMANWNTVFVEVPLITFNPVKTVNDLLSKAHRSS